MKSLCFFTETCSGQAEAAFVHLLPGLFAKPAATAYRLEPNKAGGTCHAIPKPRDSMVLWRGLHMNTQIKNMLVILHLLLRN